jgi:outer membrane protein
MGNILLKSLVFFLGLFFILTALPVGASEPPLKIGILDLQRCIQQSEAGKKASKSLQEKSDRIKKDLTTKREDLKKIRDEFAKKSNVLSSEAKRDKEKEMLRKEEDFRDLVREKEDEMHKDEYSAMQPLLNELFEVTSKLAKEEGYTLILEAKSGVVYFNKPIDITDKVIKLFNEAKKEKKK